MDHREQEDTTAKSPIKNHPEDYKYALKKESNKAAAKRSRLKKKSVENYNNEIRKNLQEINTKLMVENDLLRTEVRRLHLILNSHKSCPISTDSFRDEMESSTIDFEIQTTNKVASFPTTIGTSSIASVASPQHVPSENRIYKIVSMDPMVVNKSMQPVHSSWRDSQNSEVCLQRNVPLGEGSSLISHSQLDTDRSQVIDLSFNDNESQISQRVKRPRSQYINKKGPDILVQAMSHLDENPSTSKSSSSKYKNTPTTSRTVRADAIPGSEELLVQGSPGFVRVTSNSISVSHPVAKKMKRFVVGKSINHLGSPKATSSDTEF